MAERSSLSTASDDAIAEDDRRTHQRLPASRLNGLSAQLQTGPEVLLKDVSRSGARFQSEARLLPGLSVALKMVTPDGVVAVRGKVVRSRMIRLDRGGMGYEAAVSFSDLIPELATAPAPEAEAAAPSPADARAEAAPVAPDAPAPAGTAEPSSVFAGIAGETAAPEPPPAAAQAPTAGPAKPQHAENHEHDDDEVPMMLLVASVSQTTAELREIFNGNDW
jgi:hypothetical protein